ncbi:MAG: CHRD domain-containing protein [Gaiellaceae bacterium]
MVTGVIDAADVTGPAGQGIAAGELTEVIRALRAGAVYANVHTSKYTGGEIRGQVGSKGSKGKNGDRKGKGK